MPSSIVTELIRKVAALEERIENLMTWQKWQMGVLAAILVAVILRAI